MSAQPATTLRFRGTWGPGRYYLAGDVVARGPHSFQAVSPHVAGGQSEPGLGGAWPNYWTPTDGTGGFVSPDGGPATDPAQVATLPSLPVPLGHLGDASARQAAPHLSGASMPQAAPRPDASAHENLPAVLPNASEIPDDSDVSMPNVAMALSWLKQMIAHTARKKDVEDELERIHGLLTRLVERVEAGVPALEAENLVQREAWRRKLRVLNAATRGEGERMISAMTREYVRLLRKRDRGETLTAHEATRAAVLDRLDRLLMQIDDRAAELENAEPEDVTLDRHWPREVTA